MPEAATEKRNVEVIIGKQGRREGPGGKDAAAPPKDEEVGGRHHHCVWVVCPGCGYHRHIVVVEPNYYWYTCGHCGVDYYY